MLGTGGASKTASDTVTVKATDPDGVFAELVGTFAAARDSGTDPGAAFQATIAAEGWTGAEPA